MSQEGPAKSTQSRRRFLVRAAQGAIAGGLVFSAVDSQRLSVTNLEVPLPRLPRDLSGFKIAFASDFHYTSRMPIWKIRQAVEVMNAFHPDLTLLGGDYVTLGAHYFKPVMTELANLSAARGVYSVPGNHDHMVSINVYKKELTRAGMKDLTNAGFAIGQGRESLWIAGLDDEWTGNPKSDLAAANAPPGAPRILVTHNPCLADELPSGYADLILAGHTHGWQIYIPLLTMLVIPSTELRKYRAGFYKTAAGLMYVTRGIGTIGRSVRFWCRPEVTLITLVPAKA